MAGAIAIATAAAPASAGVPAGSTDVRVVDVTSDSENGLIVVVGRVVAQPQKCAKQRRVQLQFDIGSGFEKVDDAAAGDRAYFALAGPITGGIEQARLVAPRSKVKAGGDTVVCRRASRALAV